MIDSRNNNLSLKDFHKMSMGRTASSTADIIFKTNSHGLWLNFSSKTIKSTDDTRDDDNEREENHGIARSPFHVAQQRLFPKEQFHSAVIPAYYPGSQIEEIEEDGTTTSSTLTCLPSAIDFDMMEPDDISLLSCEDDEWSVDSDLNRTFESFDDVSILTEFFDDDDDDYDDDGDMLFKARNDTKLIAFLVELCSNPSQE